MTKDQKVTRKLRAILSADVKGYSLLMADDEVATINTLKNYRNIMSTFIEQHGGRVVDQVGDNLLAMFDSAVDAVQCSVEIQNELKVKNQNIPEDKRLEFRIGVNIGDVIQDGDRIFGDGVNISARIEGLADAGGICVSRNAYDHVKNKLEHKFEYLGEHEVKNIKEPVRVYKILMGNEQPEPLVKESLELPEKPSIAVLPFNNMSGDPSQEYFSDGLTEQIISGLCKISKLFVIARNSSFAYKGKSINIKQIADELGVKYILEGSVQRSGDRVRITAQLIDAKTDCHMWSETYDRELVDIFALQDEITMKLMNAMHVKLTDREQSIPYGNELKNIKAVDKYMRGMECFFRVNRQNNHFLGSAYSYDKQYEIAIEILNQSINIDPEPITPYLSLTSTYIEIENLEQAKISAKTILDIDPSFSLEYHKNVFPLKDKTVLDKYIENLRKAGLPD